jgi:hypothetical protein
VVQVLELRHRVRKIDRGSKILISLRSLLPVGASHAYHSAKYSSRQDRLRTRCEAALSHLPWTLDVLWATKPPACLRLFILDLPCLRSKRPVRLSITHKFNISITAGAAAAGVSYLSGEKADRLALNAETNSTGNVPGWRSP